MTQSPSPGTIYASPSGGREASSSYPIPSNGTPKRELGSPGVKRESGARDDSDQTADRSSIATRRSSTAYPDVGNDESKLDDAGGEPQRKKQKRNKPTLSCFECVERKTKVGLLSPCSFLSISTACDERSAASFSPHLPRSVRQCDDESPCIVSLIWTRTVGSCLVS